MNTGEDMTKDAPCPDKSSSLGEGGFGLLGSGRSKMWRGAIIVAAVAAAVVLAAHSMLTGSTCGKGGCGGCGWGAGASNYPLDKQYGPYRHRGGFEAVSGGVAGTGSSLAGASKDRCCSLGKNCCGDRKAGKNSGCCPLGAAAAANCPNNPGGAMKGPCPMAGGVQK